MVGSALKNSIRRLPWCPFKSNVSLLSSFTSKVGETDDLTVEIADGVRVQVVRGALSDVRSKTEPVKGGGQGSGQNTQPNGGLLSSLLSFGRKKSE